jgi:MFS family permease
VPAGLIVSKFGFRKVGFLALILVALGSLVTAFSLDFFTALLGRFIMGFGSCFLTIGTASSIPRWFQEKEMSMAMGIYSIGVPLTTIIAYFSVPLLEQSFGWQSPFWLGGILGLVLALFFAVTIKDAATRQAAKHSSLAEVRDNLKRVEVWRVGLVWFLFSVGSSGFITWAPALFQSFKGLTLQYASVLSSMYSVSIMFLIPFYGWVSDRLGSRKPLMIAGLLGMATSLFALSFLDGTALVFGVLAVGASASAVPALALASMARAVPPGQAGFGFGLMSLWNRTANVISAPLFGFLIQTTQSMSMTLVCILMFAITGAGLMLTSYAKFK